MFTSKVKESINYQIPLKVMVNTLLKMEQHGRKKKERTESKEVNIKHINQINKNT